MSAHLKALRQVDPVLTQLAVGYRQATFIGEQVMPVVNVEKEGIRVPAYGKASFVEYQTERAPHAASNVLTLDKATMLPVVLEEHDLAAGVDYREQAESMFDEKAKATRRVTAGIELRQELDIARLIQDKTVYQSGLSLDLSTAKQWSAADSDPQKNIADAKESVRAACGARPNVLVVGASVLKALKFNPTLLAMLGSGNALKMLTVDQLKVLLELDDIIVGDSVYSPDGKKLADVWGKFASLIVRPKSGESGGDEGVPSFGYTFRKRGMPFVDRYPGEGNKVEYVRYTDIRKAAVVGGACGYLFDKAVA